MKSFVCLIIACSLAFQFPDVDDGLSSPVFCEDDEHFRSQLLPTHFLTSYNIESNGYLLKIFRVRKSSSEPAFKRVILFSHGIFDSADQWLLNRQNSIAYKLLEVNYDLFFMNFRGNKFSCRHTSIEPSSAPFWDYSFQEMAEQDLKSVINFILKETGVESIQIIAHSQGTTATFAFLSTYPEMRPRVSKFIAIAPVVYLYGFKGRGDYYYWAATHNFIAILQKMGIQHLFTTSWNFDWITDKILRSFCSYLRGICEFIVSKFINKDSKEINFDILANYLQHFPSRSSLRSLDHFGQLIAQEKKELTKFDFGAERNMKEYGQSTPPSYDISSIDIPIILYAGGLDLFSPEDNSRHLQSVLPNSKLNFVPNWGHIEWFVGKDREAFVQDVLRNIG